MGHTAANEATTGDIADRPQIEQLVSLHLASIESCKKWSLSGFFSLAPSNNINNGTSTKTVELNGLPFTVADKNLRKSGIGVSFGGQAGYRLPIADKIDLLTSATVSTTVYKDSQFKVASASLSFAPKFRQKTEVSALM